MPITKLYSIITNDEYEFPVVCDISGRQAAADYLGVPLTTFSRHLKDGKWKGNFKAVEVGEFRDLGEFSANDRIKPLSEEERRVKYLEIKKERQTLGKEKAVEYSREYYKRNKQRVLSSMKDYYQKNKERRCDYGKEYRKQIKRGERVCFARST